MSDKYFNEAQIKVLIAEDGDVVSKRIIEIARIIYDEAQALKPADPRLSDDPLTALAAVMRHHKMLIDSTRGHIKILQRKDGFIISGILSHDLCVLTADDIKPEQ